MAPLKLTARLQKVRLTPAASPQLLRDGILTLEGVQHVVGMLSSGKSTLVLALLLTLARPEYGRRILVLAPDTTAAAILSARLKLHGIRSTVLASFRNRDKHLGSIHWHQAMTGTSGWSVSGVGRLVSDFGVACPLDGHQTELKVVSAGDGAVRFPLIAEKPCHSLEQERTPVEDSDQPSTAPPKQQVRHVACPFFSRCPAHSQQRAALDAQVVVMTASAFLLSQPDANVLADSMSFPELAQFAHDLVIVDEADEVQRRFDDSFSVPAPIMGGEGSYLPESALAVHTAIRNRGGAQYSSWIAVAWHAHLSRLQIAISGLYSLLLTRWGEVSHLHLDAEFTAATILSQLWRERDDRARKRSAAADEPVDRDAAFQRILRLAGRLDRLDEPDPTAREDDPDDDTQVDGDEAIKPLVALRAQLRNGVPWRSLVPETIAALEGPLRMFNTFEVLKRSESAKKEVFAERNALAILAALYANIVLASFNFLVRNQPAVSDAFELESYTVLDRTRSLMQKFRSLIPESPGGNAFGLIFEPQGNADFGANLKLLTNLGVGRYLLTHLHALLLHEGQAGPHVLLLSGTSWAGGQMTMPLKEESRPVVDVSIASPSYDVQVPVAGYLEQPAQELEELSRSVFELMPVLADKVPISVSGQTLDRRRANLQRIAQHLIGQAGDRSRLQLHWARNAKLWGTSAMDDRQHALLVVQSYRDAAIVANELQRQIDAGAANGHTVYCLVSDDYIRPGAARDPMVRLQSGVVALPRSLIEDFGGTPAGSILVAPLVLLARGHNILNSAGVAAISTIYFLHRPHPRPDDRSSMVGQINRFALDCIEQRIPTLTQGSVLERARRQRAQARAVTQRSRASRGGYSTLPDEERARFAWDFVTPLWQAIGRGIRGGAPIYVRFVDARFSPNLFMGLPDKPGESCLLEIHAQLRDALNPAKNSEFGIAEKLYGPLYRCLSAMFEKITESAAVAAASEHPS